MKNKYADLIKNVLLFAISSFIPKALSFVLIPIYTGCLTTEQYGVADLISTTVELVVPIFTLTIYDAVLRFVLDERYEASEVVSVGIQITGIGTALLSSFTFFAFLLFDFIRLEYAIFFILLYIGSSCKNIFSVILRGTNKVSVIAIGGILHSVITLLSNILFLVVFKWGLSGYLLANVGGIFCSLIFEFFCGKIYKLIKLKCNNQIKKEMVRFSFPMIFSALAWWVNNASDRYILSWIAGVSISGLYAVASKLPGIVSIFQNVFSQAWSISAIKEFDANDSDGFIGNLYTIFNFCVLFLAMVLIICNLFISKILFSKDFYVAWKYTPPLIVASVFNAFAVFIGGIFIAVKDTKNRSIATIIGAIVNTMLNFILIYLYDGYGAAIATVVGFFTTYVYQEIKIRKHIKMQAKLYRNYIGCLLLFAQMILAYWGNRFIVLQGVLILGVIVLYFDVIIKFFNKHRKI